MEQRLYLESILKPIPFLWVPEVTESWAWTKERELQGDNGCWVGITGPAYQLHAQAVLLPAVIAVNLLPDVLYRGWVLCLLHCLTDILEQTTDNVYSGSQDNGAVSIPPKWPSG